jgi:predicted amidohydrolase
MVYFGMIPIVLSTPLDPLYRGIPVVVVKSWDEVTPANLDRWWALHREAVRDNARIFTPEFWVNRTLCGPTNLTAAAEAHRARTAAAAALAVARHRAANTATATAKPTLR